MLEGENGAEADSNGFELSEDSLAQLRADYAESNPLFNVLRPAIYQIQTIKNTMQ